MVINRAPFEKRKEIKTFFFLTQLFFLSHIAKLSHLIQIRSTYQPETPTRVDEEDSALFFKSFPIFIWLLRDVVLSLPEKCFNVKDYFLSTVSTFFNNIPSTFLFWLYSFSRFVFNKHFWVLIYFNGLV